MIIEIVIVASKFWYKILIQLMNIKQVYIYKIAKNKLFNIKIEFIRKVNNII